MDTYENDDKLLLGTEPMKNDDKPAAMIYDLCTNIVGILNGLN